MIVQYRTNYQDFKQAQRTFYKAKKLGALRFALWVWVLPALGIVAASALAYDIAIRHFGFTPVVGGVLSGLAWFGLFVLVMRPINIRRAFRQMKNGRSDSDPLELEIAGCELISRIPGLSEGRFRRAAIVDTAEDQEVLLLFIAKKQFLLLPKRELSPENLQAIRRWLERAD